MYDDDGHTLGYRDGSDRRQTWIQFEWNNAARRLTVAPGTRGAGHPFARAFDVQLMGHPSRTIRVEYEGKPVETKLPG